MTLGLSIAIKHKGCVYLTADAGKLSMMDWDPDYFFHNYSMYHEKIGEHSVYLSVQSLEPRFVDILYQAAPLFQDIPNDAPGISMHDLVDVFVPKLFKLSESYGLLDPDESSRHLNGECIIACNDQLFIIHVDGAVKPIEEFVAIGSSDTFAYGAYNALRDHVDDTKQLIKDILRATSINSYKLRFPMLLVDVHSDAMYHVVETLKTTLKKMPIKS